MADFVAILKKALDKHGDETPEKRTRIYDSVGSMLAKKLAEYSPPLAAEAIAGHKRSLEDAIASVEREYTKSVLEADPLAELELIFSSIDRNKYHPSHARMPMKTEPAWQRPARSKPRNKPPPELDQQVAETVLEIGGISPDYVPSKPSSPSSPSSSKPPEPTTTAGPHYQIRGGKLASSLSPPGDAEIEMQRKLHSNLKAAVRDAVALIPSIKNRFPELSRTVEAYEQIVDCETEQLDVVNLWSVGGALYGFESAYRSQNVIRTLSEPIEPQIESALHNIARLHGAFIMGFEEGRDLVSRSDAFMHEEELVNSLREPGDKLIAIFSENADLVEARTRAVTKPIADYVHEFGWTGTRTGYAAHIIVKNGILAILRALIGKPTSALDAAGKVMTLGAIVGGVSNAEFARVALPILLRNASTILAFVNHSPEFRAYVEWALAVLHEDRK
ncbi:hypothetical protein [Mesorhizobium sp. WSM4312]|uniref:hypothetical protein n=1 Tax=Mesorhizobium sp. WSM4312 TaxID=2029411 RepID=UPI001FDFC336|nr:hypothetical protein [Mesorhizobium sp. WSM4312]